MSLELIRAKAQRECHNSEIGQEMRFAVQKIDSAFKDKDFATLRAFLEVALQGVDKLQAEYHSQFKRIAESEVA